MAAYNSTDNTTCVNWNKYYTNCSAGEANPFKGAINFDNIGYAWIAIFQVCCMSSFIADAVKTYTKTYKNTYNALKWQFSKDAQYIGFNSSACAHWF